MSPEKIIELLQSTGGGILALIIVLLGAFFVVAWFRMKKPGGRPSDTGRNKPNPSGPMTGGSQEGQ